MQNDRINNKFVQLLNLVGNICCWGPFAFNHRGVFGFPVVIFPGARLKIPKGKNFAEKLNYLFFDTRYGSSKSIL